ncbi:hypothetical protein Y88_1971 [Novosphingobium nitrogenifigens DSM 19370]|uniref:Uncharacterized protein n=1 Tax=Novosphingobium nitrogenifigens DSM 19370 TaxID=983920 RepID=F1Z5I7_9SPHN|nr:hypothetical protein Y88_1971 [Novosphingobium nitrogenifigens DSM 19370]
MSAAPLRCRGKALFRQQGYRIDLKNIDCLESYLPFKSPMALVTSRQAYFSILHVLIRRFSYRSIWGNRFGDATRQRQRRFAVRRLPSG